jgi:hypothetical protein
MKKHEAQALKAYFNSRWDYIHDVMDYEATPEAEGCSLKAIWNAIDNFVAEEEMKNEKTA